MSCMYRQNGKLLTDENLCGPSVTVHSFRVMLLAPST
jgi:hypothetical protein